MKHFDIYNEQQLRQVLKKLGRDVTWAVEQSVYDHLVEETKRTIYASEPSRYKRTYEFLNSISSDTYYKNGHYVCQVYFDTNKMSVGQGIFTKNVKGKMVNVTYGKHANSKGEDVRDKLVMYLEEGMRGSRPYAYSTSGKKVGLHMYQARPGGHMVKNTRKWISNSMVPVVLKSISDVCDNRVLVYK